MGNVNGFGWAGLNDDVTGTLFREATANDPVGPINGYVITNVLGFALDMDNNKLFTSKNGVWENSGDPVGGTGAIYSSIPAGTWYSAVSLIAQNSSVTYNFGAAGPSYSIPTGYTMPDYTPPVTIGFNNITLSNITI